MAYTYSAGVIYQTGTETSLAGLTGLTGVTKYSGFKTTYILSSCRMYIQGTMSFDPLTEELIFDDSCVLPAIYCDGSGNLTIGSLYTTAGGTYNATTCPAITVLKQSYDSYSGSYDPIIFAYGGWIKHYAGTIDIAGSLIIEASAGVCYFNSDIVFRNTTSSGPGRFRLKGAGLAQFSTTARLWYDGIELNYGSGTTDISNLTIIQPKAFGLHAQGGASSLASPVVLNSVNIIEGAAETLYPYFDTIWSCIDFLGGGNTTMAGGGMTAGQYILVRMYATLNLTVTNNGSAVSGAKVFARDVNNGSRSSYTVAGPATYNETPDITYTQTTDGSGLATAVVLLANKKVTTTLTVTTDWRTTAVGTNKLNFYISGYTINKATTAPDLSAAGAKSIPVYVSTDSNVTLSQASAAALTSIATLDNLYDASKNWATTSGNLEYPTALTIPINPSGTTLDLGAINLVVDATAGSAFAVNTGTNTITIKSSTLAIGSKFTKITTTGTVSTANGATISCLYTDTTGSTSILNITGLSGHSVYLQNASAVQKDYQSSVTGTYSYYVPATSTGTWTYVIKKAGYTYQRGTFNAAGAAIVTVAQNTPQKLAADGTAMYTASSSALCTINITSTTQANIDIGDGSVTLQEAFDMTEAALATNAGCIWLTVRDECNIFRSASGNFLFESNNWRIRRRASGNVNATLLAYVSSTQGITKDGTNGDVVIFGVVSASDIASAVWASVLDGSYTASQMMKLMGSVAAGNATGLNGSPRFKSLDGTKTRIVSSLSSDNRTVQSIDVS